VPTLILGSQVLLHATNLGGLSDLLSLVVSPAADPESYASRYNPSSSSNSTLHPPPPGSGVGPDPGVDRSSFGSLRSNEPL
jgi:hypothetical protein